MDYDIAKKPQLKINNIVRTAVRARGVVLDDLAPSIGMSLRTLHRRLSGEIPWSLDELGRLARVLDLELSDLV